jgi:transcriptional antiterminator NusG
MDLEEGRLEEVLEEPQTQEITEEKPEAPVEQVGDSPEVGASLDEAEEVAEAPESPAAEDSSADGTLLDEAEEVAEAPEAPAAEEARHPDRAWYVIHSYSGYENKVKKNLEQRIESMGMQDQIYQVIVPTEEEVEMRDGHRRTTRRRVFPGYLLVDMVLSDDSWYVVRNTPGVTGFVGSGSRPTALRQDEVDKILKRMESEAPRVRVTFREGQRVRIVEGPFADFIGTVDELDVDRGKVRVLVSFFGRETPVELDFLQVERA